VVAYQALAGTVPYDGEDSFSIGYKHITEPVPTPQLITADERRLFEVIKRMLMKDPADRFQSCEELVASLQGQPIAAAGSVRASVAAAGVGAGGGPMVPSPSLGGPALIVSQPTTPIESPLVNRRQTPRERRDNPRRVADRSVAMRRNGSGLGWLWLVLAIAGGVGGAAYYYSKRGFAPFAAAAAADSVAADSAATADSLRAAAASAADSAPAASRAPASPAPAPTGSGSPPPAAAPASPPAAAPRPAPRPAGGPPIAPVSNDSGSIRLVGLPRGSTVLIDERPVTDPTTRLSPGPHVLAVSAPRFNFFTDTIVIRPGDTLELTPQLQPLGAPVRPASPGTPPALPRATARCSPGAGYNADGSCFDERPKPVSPPFVPLPEGVTGSPRPSLLWVKVSAEGRTLDLRRLQPSDDSTFERAAHDFVWSVTWHPALKDGAPVEAWTQMLFPPQPD
jgi:hypothetical protein